MVNQDLTNIQNDGVYIPQAQPVPTVDQAQVTQTQQAAQTRLDQLKTLHSAYDNLNNALQNYQTPVWGIAGSHTGTTQDVTQALSAYQQALQAAGGPVQDSCPTFDGSDASVSAVESQLKQGKALLAPLNGLQNDLDSLNSDLNPDPMLGAQADPTKVNNDVAALNKDLAASSPDASSPSTPPVIPGTAFRSRSPGETGKAGYVDTALFKNDPFTGISPTKAGTQRYGSPPAGAPPPPGDAPAGTQWIYVQPYNNYAQDGCVWNIAATCQKNGFGKGSTGAIEQQIIQANRDYAKQHPGYANSCNNPNLIYSGWILAPA